MSRPEILAPAGDDESLAAALAAGAEAVYFGLDGGLNARARATNFSLERLPAIADTVHRAGARAYITLNTLVFEHELPAVEAAIRGCAGAGIDALIVQDPAVALLARAVAPTLEVHASTQMTISSPEGAAFAEQLGVTRVVVPRELSVAEIRTFARGTRLELEVFVHGALCMSWSGQCLTSEAWGGRSANRGQCAQSCRLPYDLVVDGEPRPLGDVAYLLSPLDLAGVDAIAGLADVGVASLKIEGRLKGPAYVVSAVEGYRRWRDAVLAGTHTEPAAQQQLRADVGQMAVAYSRGFSPGFLSGTDHQTLVEGRFPKSRGALLGEVVEVRGARVRVRRAERTATGGVGLRGRVALPILGASTSPPSSTSPARVAMTPPEPVPGCGVGFDTGRPEEVEPGGPLFAVDATADGWWLAFGTPGPDLAHVHPGDRVWLSSDPRLLARARAAVDLADRGVPGRIPVRLEVSGVAGRPLRVHATALGSVGRGCSVELTSDEPLAPATHGGLGPDLLTDKLGAFGGTCFRLDALEHAALAPGLHLPVSALKRLRRRLVDALEPAVLAAARHAVRPEPAAPAVFAASAALPARRPWTAPAAPQLIPLVRTPDQLEAVIAAGLPEVELDWMELVGLGRAVDRARAAGLRVTIATTRVQKPGEDGIDNRIARLAPDAVLVRHWGGLMHFSRLLHGPSDLTPSPPVVHADFSLNVTNSITARHLLHLGCDTITAAHDLDEAQLHAMLAALPAERVTVTVHHHIPTFHTEHCVYAHTLSHGRDFRSCGRPCEQHRVALADAQGRRHPVVVDIGCRNTVFNAAAQSAAKAVPCLLAAGVRRLRVELVWEDRTAAAQILAAWSDLLAGRCSPASLHARVGALEQFGVTAGTMRTLAS